MIIIYPLTACTLNINDADNTPVTPVIMGESGLNSSKQPTSLNEAITILSSSDADYNERIAAANVLERLGSKAQVACNALVANLKSDDVEVRLAVIQALGSIGSGASKAAPHITNLLDGSFNRETRAIVRVLRELDNPVVIPSLARLLYENDDEVIQVQAAKSIGVLANQNFPDLNNDNYQVGNDGIPIIVIAAKDWWNKQGQYTDW